MEKKLFTKKELKEFGEFCREEGKTQTLNEIKEKAIKLIKMEIKENNFEFICSIYIKWIKLFGIIPKDLE